MRSEQVGVLVCETRGMSVQGRDRQIELLRMPRVPEYDAITNLDSQPAGYFVASSPGSTSVAGAATSQLGSFCGS